MKVTLTKIKETKNTVRYDHPDGESICPAIYLRKQHLPRPFPEQIFVTFHFGRPSDD